MLELSEVRLALDNGADEKRMLRALRRSVAKMLGCDEAALERLHVRRRAVDARKRDNVHFICTVRFTSADEDALFDAAPERVRAHLRFVEADAPAFPAPLGARPARRPVVVGAGCAGLFCALALAHAGLEPLLIERGDGAQRRTAACARFDATGELDPESNIQFGLGGAGTFSDGKLTTGTKNPAHRLILETFASAGAPREILMDSKPHIGSDVLPAVVDNIAARIRELGGEVRFRCRMTRVERAAGRVRGVVVESDGREERIAADRVVLACGHSARDVFSMLADGGFELARKTFAMGVRIEHRQAAIDRALYGRAAGHPALGAAPYKLVAHLPNGRSVFSFCMCPGGQVVAAASEPGGVVVNGASLYARAGENANAALLVNVVPENLPGDDPLAGVALQRRCEQAAFAAGGGGYRAPAQLLGDFLARRPSAGPGGVRPTYPRGVTWSEMDGLLPAHVIETLREGIPRFERRIHGYTARDAVLTGVETRSSSPVTVLRDRETLQALGAAGLYPCGEGAGYAGGIMSAATDGIRCAEALIASLA